MLPTSPISTKATAVIGLHVVSGQLFYNTTKVDSVNIQTCLIDFNNWLKDITKPLLVCHNGKKFDSIILVKSILKYPECDLRSSIGGFVDSLPVFREIFPDKPSHKLETLVQDTMGMTYNAHSALEDVKGFTP